MKTFDELESEFVPEHDEILKVVRHTLEAKEFCVQHEVSSALVNLEGPVRAFHSDDLAVRLCAYIYGKDNGVDRHEHPSDWWSAFKFRWFPQWALRRWPPALTVIEAHRGIIYPEFSNCGRGVSADKLVIREIKAPPL